MFFADFNAQTQKKVIIVDLYGRLRRCTERPADCAATSGG